MPASTQPRPTRPAGAPAYYLGRPASLWLAAVRRARPPRPGAPAARTTAARETR